MRSFAVCLFSTNAASSFMIQTSSSQLLIHHQLRDFSLFLSVISCISNLFRARSSLIGFCPLIKLWWFIQEQVFKFLFYFLTFLKNNNKFGGGGIQFCRQPSSSWSQLRSWQKDSKKFVLTTCTLKRILYELLINSM